MAKLEGSKRAKYDRRNEPKPDVPDKVPAAPAWLSVSAKAVWRRLAPVCHRSGTLTEQDRDAFAFMCEQMAEASKRMKEARDELAHTMTADGGLKPHPAHGVRSTMLRDALRLMEQFGLTPASRARIQSEAEDTGEDPLDRIQADIAGKIGRVAG